MSIADKAMKLKDGQILYNDLRNRHEGVKESIAPEYADLTFPVTQGAHCFHEGVYYRAKQNIQTSEDWTAAHWETDAIEAELSSLKSAINVLQPAATSGDVGKFLKAKTVTDGKVSEYEFGSASGGGVSDVQVNGTSVVSNGVANIPYGSTSDYGLIKLMGTDYGVYLTNSGGLRVNPAYETQLKAQTNEYRPLTPYYLKTGVFYGLASAAGDTTQKNSSNTEGTYTESAKSAISDMLNAPVSVSGTTPSITAKSGVRYICGECSTLTVEVPATGIIDVVFESGSTPTVLTVTPPTGMTMKWIGADPTALEANKTYEVNIMDGCYGMVVAWT